MKVGALVSGGKDSLMALLLAKKKGHKPIVLISIKSRNPESYMYHTHNIDLVKLQADAMELPLILKQSKGEKEKELEDLKLALQEAKKEFGIQGVVSGAIYSKYQKQRVDKICKELGLESIAPLWHVKQEKYAQDLIKNKFKVIITAIASDNLTKDWLGKEINKDTLEKLKQIGGEMLLIGEGGEFESLVLDCPLFKKKLKILKADKIMTGSCSGYYNIKDAVLAEKNI